MKRHFVAIDPSLVCTGIYVYAPTLSLEYTVAIRRSKHHKDRYSVLAELHDYLDVILTSRNIKLAVVEKYAFAARGNAMTKLAEVGGVVYMTLAKRGVAICEIASQTWKLLTLGDARVKKKDVPEFAWALYKIAPQTQDELDAWLIGKAVRMALDPRTELIGSANTSLGKLRKGLEEALGEEVS